MNLKLNALKGLLISIGLVAVPLTAGAVPILQISGGILTGAIGVDVGGVSYNVEFVDGTCAGVFGACDQAHFAFNSAGDATAAAQALLDQVFLDSGSGNFDSTANLTFGCTYDEACGVWTPYNVSAPQSVLFGYTLNYSAFPDVASLGFNFFFTDTSDSVSSVWAVWSPTAVPEPSTFALFGAGLLGLAAIRRRRRAKG